MKDNLLLRNAQLQIFTEVNIIHAMFFESSSKCRVPPLEQPRGKRRQSRSATAR